MSLSWKPTLAILIVCGTAIAAVWALQEAAPQAPEVPYLNPASVVRVRVEWPSHELAWEAEQVPYGDTTRWMLREPIEEPARTDLVNALLQALNGLSNRRRAPSTASPEERRERHLTDETAERIVTVTTTDDAVYRYVIGTEDVLTRGFYVLIPGNAADTYLLSDTDFMAFDMRPPLDPHVVGWFSMDLARAVDVNNRLVPTASNPDPRERFAIELHADAVAEWIVVRPEALAGERIDVMKMSLLLQAIREMIAEREAAGDAVLHDSNLAEYGLDAAVKTVTFTIAEESIELRLAQRTVERDEGDAIEYWAWCNRFPDRVSRVSREAFESIPMRLDDLRSRQIYHWFPQQVVGYRIEVIGEDGTAVRRELNMVQEIPAEGEEGPPHWRLITPDPGTAPFDEGKAWQLIEATQSEQIVQFLARDVTDLTSWGLDPPAVRLTIRLYGIDEPFTYLFGRHGNVFTGMREWTGSHDVFEIRRIHYDFLSACDLLLRPGRILDLDPESINGILCSGVFRHGTGDRVFHWEVVRREGHWRRVEESGLQFEIDDVKFTTLLARLANLHTEGCATWNPAEWPDYGLDPENRGATLTVRYHDNVLGDRQVTLLMSGTGARERMRWATIQGVSGLDGVVWRCPDDLWDQINEESIGIWVDPDPGPASGHDHSQSAPEPAPQGPPPPPDEPRR